MRLGVYMDLDYRWDGRTVSTEHAVVRFLTELAPRLGGLTLFGRLDARPDPGPYALPPDVAFKALPHYPRVTALRAVASGARRAVDAFTAELDRVDAVWLFGPHPLALAFAAIARRHRKPVVLGIRQDFPRYITGRLPSRLWSWAVPAAWAGEGVFRLLARRLPAVVVGDDLARKYRAGGGPVLATGFSLVRATDLVPLDEALARPWDGELRLLNVGRLGPEKNPTLLPEVVALLREGDPRWRLAVAGVGEMEDAIRRRAVELGVSDAVELLGYVPNGPALRDEYRRSHAFLHVSHTEGLPQVLAEAHAAGVPIVATEVGGVAAGLAGGATGLLVPPGDPHAAARALERLRDDERLREELVARGLAQAGRETMDVQLDRIAEFLHRHARRP
jgi:glycosyltransferase involved in cell wall biosynthesis